MELDHEMFGRAVGEAIKKGLMHIEGRVSSLERTLKHASRGDSTDDVLELLALLERRVSLLERKRED